MGGPSDVMRQLKAAEASARQQSATVEPGSAVAACPASQERKALEVIVVGEDDQPLMDIAIELGKGSDQAMRSKTNSNGHVRFEGLDAGAAYQLRLIELDKEAWEIH